MIDGYTTKRSIELDSSSAGSDHVGFLFRYEPDDGGRAAFSAVTVSKSLYEEDSERWLGFAEQEADGRIHELIAAG